MVVKMSITSKFFDFTSNNPINTVFSALAGAGAGLLANKLYFHKPASAFIGVAVAVASLWHAASNTANPVQGLANRTLQLTTNNPLNRPNPILPVPQQQTPRNTQPIPAFETEIANMVQKGYLKDASLHKDLLSASRLRSPFNFYGILNNYVDQKKLTPETAYYVLRAYDKAKQLSTKITDGIAQLVHTTKKLSSTQAYLAIQTYRMVLDHGQLYERTLHDIYPNPRDAKRVENLLAYRSVRQASNGAFKAESDRLRKETAKGDVSRITSPPLYRGKISIEVWPMTTFLAAQTLVQDGFNPAALNMANETEPGGGFLTGATAQEEHLCRQSNLYEGLEFARNRGEYPIGEFEVIVVPKTTFFRDDQYQNLKRPIKVDVMTSAAYICEGPMQNRPASEKEYQAKTKDKMRSMFRAAIHNGNDSLLLSAFGCGAFKNDPKIISQLYKAVLSEPEFQGRFRKVVFGIIDDRNGTNLNPFQQTFSAE